jgi:membrane-bound lytic murein transglycosylase MltF
MLAAQGFQESKARPEREKPCGAIHIMQIMPATGAELKVGDIHIAVGTGHHGDFTTQVE